MSLTKSKRARNGRASGYLYLYSRPASSERVQTLIDKCLTDVNKHAISSDQKNNDERWATLLTNQEKKIELPRKIVAAKKKDCGLIRKENMLILTVYTSFTDLEIAGSIISIYWKKWELHRLRPQQRQPRKR
jgi:hypothetical protein